MRRTLAFLQARTTQAITPTARTAVGASACEVAPLWKSSFSTSVQKRNSMSCGFTTAPPPQVSRWRPSLASWLPPTKWFQQSHRCGSISARMIALREADSELPTRKFRVGLGNFDLMAMILPLMVEEFGYDMVLSMRHQLAIFACVASVSRRFSTAWGLGRTQGEGIRRRTFPSSPSHQPPPPPEHFALAPILTRPKFGGKRLLRRLRLLMPNTYFCRMHLVPTWESLWQLYKL